MKSPAFTVTLVVAAAHTLLAATGCNGRIARGGGIDAAGGGGTGPSGGGGGAGGGGGSCAPDLTVTGCASGDGYECPAGAPAPDVVDPSLTCSEPIADGPNDEYCCLPGSPGFGGGLSCAFDPSLDPVCAAQDPSSFGYSCDRGDNPMNYDSSFTCSAAVADGASDDFCCFTGVETDGGAGGGGTSCVPDTTVADCAEGDGYVCAAGEPPPDATNAALLCSVPTDEGGAGEAYCCITSPTFDSGTCAPFPLIDGTCPDPNSFGFACAGADTPEQSDPSLVCSPDQGTGDFCCTAE